MPSAFNEPYQAVLGVGIARPVLYAQEGTWWPPLGHLTSTMIAADVNMFWAERE